MTAARCPTCDREGCEWWTLGTPSQPKNSMANVSKIDGRTLPSNCLAQNTFDDCGRHAVDWRARAIAAEDDAARWQRVAPLIEQLRAWSDAPPIVSAVVREIFVIIDDRAAPEGETP